MEHQDSAKIWDVQALTGTKKILVVDDSLTIRMQVKELLEDNGLQVLLAENGKMCLKVLEKESPDVILLDVIMPEMDGIEVCRRIKSDEALKEIPILILTTVSDVENKVRGLNAGADDYVTKPFEIVELIARVNSILRTKAMFKQLQKELTDRKRFEQELKQSEERFHNLVETANAGIIAAENGVITQVNKKAEEIYGYTREELIGQPPGILAPVSYKKQHQELLEKMLSSAKVAQLTFEEAGVRKDGSLFPVDMSFSLSKREDGFGVIAVITDITERKLAEEELKKTKEHLDNVIESSADSIIIADPTGTIVKTNKAFLELLGREEKEVVGKHIVELTVMEEGTYESTTGELIEMNEEYFESGQAMTATLFEEGKISNWENYYLREDKKVVPVEMSIVFLYDQQGERTGSVGINRDITNRKKMEKQLKEATLQLVQSEKLSALGELTAGVAHELNQPLNGIKIISQSLLKDIEKGQFDEKELGEDLKDVVNQVNKMAEIIDHMRIFTRRSEGVPREEIDLNDIVGGAFKFLGQQLRNHNIEVQEDLGPELPKVVGDPIRLEQVFLNLVSNARNAMEQAEKEKKRIEIRTYADNTNGDSSVVLEVKDNGGGVPEHARGKIFQPFFTTNAPGKGTGLGLSVSSKIIEEHRGRIEMDSTVGEGATFRVILPAVS